MSLSGIVAPRLLDIGPVPALFLGILISIFGIFGDLLFSSIKRNLAIKDFSKAIPGHGGFLDRLDSLIFTAPVYFYYITYIKGYF